VGKQKPKPQSRETLCILLEAVFEGDICKGVLVRNPYLSHEKILSLSYVLFILVNALKEKDRLEVKQVECGKLINEIAWGRME